jgi:hypothetical protein
MIEAKSDKICSEDFVCNTVLSCDRLQYGRLARFAWLGLVERVGF